MTEEEFLKELERLYGKEDWFDEAMFNLTSTHESYFLEALEEYFGIVAEEI